MKKHTNVLLVNGHSMHESNSTGITLRSIVSYFHPNSIQEVFYYPINITNQPNNYHSIQLDPRTKLIYPFFKKIYSGKIKEEIDKTVLTGELHHKVSALQWAKRYILALDDYLPFTMKFNISQNNKIDEFGPQVIYTLGSSIFTLGLSLYYSKRYNIPIVLHHMDNWRETKYNFLNYINPFRKKLITKLNETECLMKCGLTISDEMAEYYKTVSGKKYLSLMNTVPNLKIPIQRCRLDGKINIVYAGGLHLDRWKVLREIENAIKSLGLTKAKVQLIVFTKDSDRKKYEGLFDSSITMFYDFLPHDQVYKAYEMADILLHVESFDGQLVKFTKFSISTKIPEYMSTGRPIICYAPKDLAVYKYIEKNICGISVSNKTELNQSLQTLINDENKRIEMGSMGQSVCSIKHSEEYKNKVMEDVF